MIFLGNLFILCMQDFDPVRHVLEHIPLDENELEYFEKQVFFLIIAYSDDFECNDTALQ